MSKLDRNLHALAICYRISGGILGLAVSLLFILIFGGALAGGGSFAILGMLFPLLFLLLIAGLAFALFEVANALQNHERRTFCLVVAWLACALFPLGTVLGVFTILQLIQPEAERAFSEADLPYVKMEDFRPQAGNAAEQ